MQAQEATTEMHDESELSDWSGRYAAWLERARPLLEQENWKDAFAAGYPFPAPAYTPWAPVAKPLAETRLALISTAGFYLRGEQAPFRAEHIEGDHTFRVLPDDVRREQLAIAHTHYPHAAVEADWNTVLPLDHLREMVREGRLRGLGPIFSISGYCTDAALLCRTTAREIAASVRAAGCDAALLVPV